MLHDESYRNKWEAKKRWYDQHFPGRLAVTTMDSGDLTRDAAELISGHFS